MLTIEVKGAPEGAGLFKVQNGRCVIGKDLDCELPLAGWRVSKRHAEIFVSNERVFVRDLESTFGTMVNEQKVDQARALSGTDELRIGSHALRVYWQRPEDALPAAEATAPPAAASRELAIRPPAATPGAPAAPGTTVGAAQA
ncbi:FHA domain-containing protein, partial [Ideonella sp.]|uniref:FHA domain-containing protein n=1 Tax=Ideonella sp. TaxID=1929293 RepID=UPI003BB4CFDD